MLLSEKQEWPPVFSTLKVGMGFRPINSPYRVTSFVLETLLTDFAGVSTFQDATKGKMMQDLMR